MQFARVVLFAVRVDRVEDLAAPAEALGVGQGRDGAVLDRVALVVVVHVDAAEALLEHLELGEQVQHVGLVAVLLAAQRAEFCSPVFTS